MMLYCPDCAEDVEAEVDDCSFGHEFGVEYIYDYYCPNCHRILHTSHSRPRKEIEEP